MGKVTFLGVEGSGKTVLTMALVNAFKAHEADGWFLRPETRGAFRFLAQVPENVSGASLPHQTTALRQLQWSVVYGNEVQRTLDILDYPGEVYRLAFLDAKDDPDPAGFRERVTANKEEIDALLGHLMDSDQIFVLFNLEDGQDLANNPANLDAVWVTNACLDYLHRLPSHPSITLLLTQIDKYVPRVGTFDPQAFIRERLSSLSLIAHNFPNLDVVAVSAIGTADTAFGVDNILLRCLIDAPMSASWMRDIKGSHDTIMKAWEDYRRTGWQLCVAKLKAELARHARLVMPARAPWFCGMEALCGGGVAFSQEECADLARLARYLPPSDLVDLSLDTRQYWLQKLDALPMTTATGAVWQNQARQLLKRSRPASTSSTAAEETGDGAAFWLLMIGLLLIVAMIFVMVALA